MNARISFTTLLLMTAVVAISTRAYADSVPAVAAGAVTLPASRAHGPAAQDWQFPSHVFRLEAHAPERVELAFHYGLLQPLLLHGFNAAIDVRYERLILTYSHGQGLDATSFVTSAEKAAGLSLKEPWTTGGGVGILLIDELWILADVKVHRFEASTPVDRAAYTNVTVGGEMGWRFFVWKGFNIGVVARYWPNVHSTAGAGVLLRDTSGHLFLHRPQAQGSSGFFGNVLLGWAFDL
jgi:hypothetical protein